MSRNQARPGCKLFVGNLSWNTTSQSLGDAFAAFGTVEDAIVLQDRETGRSRGFGFVTFSSSDEANAAVAGLDGQDVDGRQVRVNLANDRPPAAGGRGGFGGNSGF
eukprot:jgi/Hompol1/6112/HPOL_002229-RA